MSAPQGEFEGSALLDESMYQQVQIRRRTHDGSARIGSTRLNTMPPWPLLSLSLSVSIPAGGSRVMYRWSDILRLVAWFLVARFLVHESYLLAVFASRATVTYPEI